MGGGSRESRDSAIRLKQHCLPVKIEELTLARRKAAHIHQSLCLDPHPLKRRAMGDCRDDKCAGIFKANETSVE
jgi:hypothetical protein